MAGLTCSSCGLKSTICTNAEDCSEVFAFENSRLYHSFLSIYLLVYSFTHSLIHLANSLSHLSHFLVSLFIQQLALSQLPLMGHILADKQAANLDLHGSRQHVCTCQ